MNLFNTNKNSQNNIKSSYEGSDKSYQEQTVFEIAKDNIDYMKKIQEESWDLVTKEITLKNDLQTINIGLVYMAGLVDQPFLNDVVSGTISKNFRLTDQKIKDGNERIEYFKNYILTTISSDDADKYEKIYNLVLNGDMAVFIDGCKKAIIIGARKYVERGVEKPTVQQTVKGAHDSFNENLLTNVSLVRKRIKNPNLIVKNYIIGKESNANMVVMYIKGIADEELLNLLKQRISQIDAENIIDSSNLKEFISGTQYSLFPTIFHSERPDQVTGNLYEGRIAIALDNSPFILIIPSVFVQYFQSVEDFYSSGIIASFFRLIRLLSFIMALYIPGLYICVVLHHSELLPINLLYSFQGQRAPTPFPAFVELIMVMILFDLLRESGTRMPQSIGTSVTFVGAIIIGSASVEAGLLSSIVVIVTAISGITSLIMPNYQLSLTLTVLRYVITTVCILLGFYGFVLAMVVLVTHLSSLRSFGVNYFSPLAPFSSKGMKDSFVRFSLKSLLKRKREFHDKYPH